MSVNNSASIRLKLYDYIRVADDKKLNAIYNLLENEIQETKEWWKDKLLVAELDRRVDALETGSDKGVTLDQLEASISKMRKKRYGK
jgi:benzoyl-CoA reductase/2-hydroxyglutaryl-CoA dehydratase subunit BcrC/BadD/HgdB